MNLATIAGCAVIAAAACGSDEAPNPRPNLILISLDTCRADRLSCYGAERPTPNLDRMAAQAVRFTDCLAQSCVTAPSHMSLFTGQYVQRHGLRMNGEGRRPGTTLASVLRDAGWRTAAFTGHGSLQARYGHAEGFDVFQSWSGPERWPHSRDLRASVPEALAWLEDHDEEPFFLFLHGYDTHCPYWPPKGWRVYSDWYAGRFDPRRECGPKRFDDLIANGTIGEEELRYVSDLYDGELAGADAVLGEFFDELRGRALWNNSIIVFTSDHGEALGENGRIGHGALSEEILRVPLLMRFPDARWIGAHDAPVQLVDIFPTLLSALGVATPAGIQGTDLMPWIEGTTEPDGERMRVAQAAQALAVHFGRRWKLGFRLVGRTTTSRHRLFDLEVDPEARVNVAGDPRYRARLDELLSTFRHFAEASHAGDLVFQGPKIEPQGGFSAEQEMLQALGYAGDG